MSLAVDNSIFKFSLKWENVELMLNFLQNKQKKSGCNLCDWHYLKWPSSLTFSCWASCWFYQKFWAITTFSLFSHRNTADTEGSWLLLSSADWAHLLKTLTNLESCVSSVWPNRPAIQPCPSKMSWRAESLGCSWRSRLSHWQMACSSRRDSCQSVHCIHLSAT